jgi:hypothetical protein
MCSRLIGEFVVGIYLVCSRSFERTWTCVYASTANPRSSSCLWGEIFVGDADLGLRVPPLTLGSPSVEKNYSGFWPASTPRFSRANRFWGYLTWAPPRSSPSLWRNFIGVLTDPSTLPPRALTPSHHSKLISLYRTVPSRPARGSVSMEVLQFQKETHAVLPDWI